jgi:hypothetical protein
MKLSLLAASLVALNSLLFADEAAEKAAVAARAKTMVEATLRGEAATVLKFMPPAVVQALGGEAVLTKAIERTMADMRQIGMEFVSMDVLPPEKFHQSGSKTFAVVKTKSTMLVPGKARITEESSMIAIQEQTGGEWTFLRINEALAGNRDLLKRLLPDFPDDVKLEPPPRPQATPIEK